MNYFDELCEEIFGFIPNGKGKSYELFVNCVLQHLNEKSKITNDIFQKSGFSEDNYQLDGLLEDDYKSVKAFVESKNYLDRNAKVGREDIQKLSGALQILTNIDKGIFASATDYTKPAIQYSKDLVAAKQKSIDLYVIRPVKEEDTEGRILGININLHVQSPNLEIKDIIWGQNGCKKLEDMGYIKGQKIPILLENIYNGKKEIVSTLNDLYQTAQKSGVSGDDYWNFDPQAYLSIDGELVPFEKISYNLTYSTSTHEIKMHYEPVIYIKSLDGEVETLIDAKDLKKAYLKIKDNK